MGEISPTPSLIFLLNDQDHSCLFLIKFQFVSSHTAILTIGTGLSTEQLYQNQIKWEDRVGCHQHTDDTESLNFR